MKRLATLCILLSFLYAPLSSAQQTWTRTMLAPIVYSENAENSNFFGGVPGALPATKVTGVSWNVGLYNNGATNQEVKLCYTPPIGAGNCRNISNELKGSTTMFNGESAKGEFRVTYVLKGGGTYPANPTHSNTLTITYQ